MQFTLDQLQQVLTLAPQARLQLFLGPVNDTLDQFNITTPLRAAMFLAQIAHESGEFHYTKEIWGPTPAQSGYEGRADLGNTQPGDGFTFRGRGLIQITGRADYLSVGHGLNQDFISNPTLLETPEFAALSAGWFWNTRNLNDYADKKDIVTVTKRINGGLLGLEDREKYYERATKAVQS